MLITGISGLLGNNLAYYFKNKYEILGLYCSHPVSIAGIQTEKCDLSCSNSTKDVIERFSPSIIIHCASLTNVDQCESDPEITNKINVISTKNIVDIISDKNIKLVYISTDSVYDGIGGNFSENDNVNPLNCYGRSKYEGELEVLRKKGSVILRTNLFGWNIQDKESLAEWFLNRLQGNEPMKGFEDARFSSIYTFILAGIIEQCLEKNLAGLYNCVSSDSCSKFEFGRRLARLFNFNEDLIQSAKLADVSFVAPRGHDLSLDVNKLARDLGQQLPTIQEGLDQFHRDWQQNLPVKIRGRQ